MANIRDIFTKVGKTTNKQKRKINRVRYQSYEKLAKLERQGIIKKQGLSNFVNGYLVHNYNTIKGKVYHDPPEIFFDIPEVYLYDSIVRRAVDLVVTFATINSFRLESRSAKYLKVINTEIKDIFNNSDTTLNLIIKNILYDLVLYSNTFIHKIRDNSEKLVEINGKKVGRIIGLEVLSPLNIGMVTEKDGSISTYYLLYKQKRVKNIPIEDIVHIVMGPTHSSLWAFPHLVPVIDDLQILRRVEEDIYTLIFQHIVPLYHLSYKSELLDEEDVQPQINEMYSKIEDKLSQGALITTDRWTVEVPDRGQARIADITKYLEYFKQRVYVGLGISAISFGESQSANRATGNIVSKNIVNMAKTYMNTLKIYFDNFILRELQIQNKIEITKLSDPESVELYVPEIDVEWKQSIENHGLLLFQGNAITSAELRKDYLGKLPLTNTEIWDTYAYKFTLPGQALLSRDETIQSYLQSQQMPKNQFGAKEAPGKKADSNQIESTEEYLYFVDNTNPRAKEFLTSLGAYDLIASLKIGIETNFDGLMQNDPKAYNDISLYINALMVSYASKAIKRGIQDIIEEHLIDEEHLIKASEIFKLIKRNLMVDINSSIENIRQIMLDDDKYPTFVDKEKKIMFNMEVLGRTTLVRVYCSTKLYMFKKIGVKKAKVKFLISKDTEKIEYDLGKKNVELEPWKWHPNAVRDIGKINHSK